MTRSTRIELFKEHFKFSSGHFTIFSPTDRENLHGHNFTVGVTIDCEVRGNGIAVDYAAYKRRIADLCSQLNERFLLPGSSPHLRIEEDGGHVYAVFGDERIPFLARDVLVLPLDNITLEELSRWFLDKLVDEQDVAAFGIHQFVVKVFSGPGQSASARWIKA